MSKQRHSDEENLFKLFQKAFGKRIEAYRNVYYYDKGVRKEIDLIIKAENISMIMSLNGKKNSGLKDARRSGKHNNEQNINFLNTSCRGRVTFFTYDEHGKEKYNKIDLRGIHFLISVMYSGNNEKGIGTFDNICGSTVADKGRYMLNISYTCMVLMLRTCMFYGIRFETFATFLALEATRKIPTVLNCAPALEFTMMCMQNKHNSPILLFVDKSIDNVEISNGGLEINDVRFVRFICDSETPLFKDKHIPCSNSRHMMLIAEGLAKSTLTVGLDDRKDIYELAKLARDGKAYYFLKQDNHICSIYHDEHIMIR